MFLVLETIWCFFGHFYNSMYQVLMLISPNKLSTGLIRTSEIKGPCTVTLRVSVYLLFRILDTQKCLCVCMCERVKANWYKRCFSDFWPWLVATVHIFAI